MAIVHFGDLQGGDIFRLVRDLDDAGEAVDIQYVKTDPTERLICEGGRRPTQRINTVGLYHGELANFPADEHVEQVVDNRVRG